MTLIKTVIVDDSAFVRKVVKEMLLRSPHIDVVGQARNGADALEMVEQLKPDVVTCDLTMPELDGVGFVREQMARKPLPILLLTASSHDAGLVLDALSAGAVDFIQKPSSLTSDDLLVMSRELVRKIKGAARAPSRVLAPPESRAEIQKPAETIAPPGNVDIVVLGTSTGGPQALRYLVPQLPAHFPVPLVMVLHIPMGYTAPFAEKLAENSRMSVKEACEGCPVLPGEALLAPAGQHLSFGRNISGQVVVRLSHAPTDKPHRPSVDVLFESAAETYRNRVLGVVMTGMGDDGMQGAARIKAQGGTILTESEKSCVIYGMPRSVVEAGLSDGTVSLEIMAGEICKRL